MDFWGGNFLFTASTPNPSVGIVSYEAKLDPHLWLRNGVARLCQLHHRGRLSPRLAWS